MIDLRHGLFTEFVIFYEVINLNINFRVGINGGRGEGEEGRKGGKRNSLLLLLLLFHDFENDSL